MARQITFSTTLADLIRANGYSRNHAGVARGVSVSPSAISQYLSGKTLPSLSTLVELAGFFETDLDYLVFGESSVMGLPPAPDPVVEHLDKTLADARRQSVAHADLMGRIASALGRQISDVAGAIVAEGFEVTGAITHEDAFLLESYSLATRLVSINLQDDLTAQGAGTTTTPRFLPVVANNLLKGRRYQILLPRAVRTWEPVVAAYRELLRRNGVTNTGLALCEFRSTEVPIAVGYGVYELDIEHLEKDHPIFFERIQDVVCSNTHVCYLHSASTARSTNPTMDAIHTALAIQGFDSQWQARRTSLL
jgi:transcriptional regulator with XRE-family HTH domain